MQHLPKWMSGTEFLVASDKAGLQVVVDNFIIEPLARAEGVHACACHTIWAPLHYYVCQLSVIMDCACVILCHICDSPSVKRVIVGKGDKD